MSKAQCAKCGVTVDVSDTNEIREELSKMSDVDKAMVKQQLGEVSPEDVCLDCWDEALGDAGLYSKDEGELEDDEEEEEEDWSDEDDEEGEDEE